MADKKGVNPIAAGIAGAVAGAGLAVGATQALKNEQVKKKADELVKKARKSATQMFEDRAPKEAKKAIKTISKDKDTKRLTSQKKAR